MTFATYSLALVENAKFVPLLLSLRDYGIKEVQMIWHAYIKSYLACNGYCFMLYRILWPYKINILCAWYSPSDDLQESSQFMVMGLGQKCKVALWYKLFSLRTLRNLLMRMLIPSFLIFFFYGKKGILNVCPLEKVPTYVLICSENPFWWTLTTDWQWEFSNYTSLQL